MWKKKQSLLERKKERKKLDMRPLPRARVKLGGWTRSPRFWWKKPFDPCDPKSKFEPISFEEGSTWCICMSYIDKVRIIEEIMHVLVKIKVWPLWPKWPQVALWPHNIGRGSQANVHVWIVWSCYIQRTSYSIFCENDLLTPVTPNDPRWIFTSSWCICMNHMTIPCNL